MRSNTESYFSVCEAVVEFRDPARASEGHHVEPVTTRVSTPSVADVYDGLAESDGLAGLVMIRESHRRDDNQVLTATVCPTG